VDFAKALELSVPADYAVLRRWYDNRVQPPQRPPPDSQVLKAAMSLNQHGATIS